MNQNQNLRQHANTLVGEWLSLTSFGHDSGIFHTMRIEKKMRFVVGNKWAAQWAPLVYKVRDVMEDKYAGDPVAPTKLKRLSVQRAIESLVDAVEAKLHSKQLGDLRKTLLNEPHGQEQHALKQAIEKRMNQLAQLMQGQAGRTDARISAARSELMQIRRELEGTGMAPLDALPSAPISCEVSNTIAAALAQSEQLVAAII